MILPHVLCQLRDGLVQSSFGFALESIYLESLRTAQDQPLTVLERWKESHSKNTRLMQLISEWPTSLTIDLHIASLPSLDNEQPGKIRIGIQFHEVAANHNAALELALSDAFRLHPLLGTFWDHAEFQPVPQDEFAETFRPFRPESCLRITRRWERISLTQPFSHRGDSIGFNATGASPSVSARSSNPETVDHLFPWIPSVGEDWSSLLATLLRTPTPRWIRIRMSRLDGNNALNASRRRLRTTIERCERFLAGASLDQITMVRQAQAIRDCSLRYMAQFDQGTLGGSVLLFFPGESDFVAANLLGQTLSAYPKAGSEELLFEGGFNIQFEKVSEPAAAADNVATEVISSEEAACAMRLPLILRDHNCGLPVRRFRTVPADIAPPDKGGFHLTRLAINIHRGMPRPIEIQIGDRLRHTLLIGQTGTGKSTLMLSLLLQDLRAGHGACLIDPHGDLADDLLALFPADRAEDLILIDFEDHERPVPMNLLKWQTIEERDLIIDELLATLLRIYVDYQMFGPVFEAYFRSGLKLLMGDKPSGGFIGTLLEFPKLFQNTRFRDFLLEGIDDEQLRDADMEARHVTGGELKMQDVAPYVTSKFSRVIQDTLIRRIVGHGDMALNFRNIMDGGKVVIIKLARGRFGAKVSDIITSQIVSRFRLAAMSRANLAKEARRPFFLYVDEFQAVADDNFSQLLSESRKYGLGLVLANQYAGQLRDEHSKNSVLNAVLGNVGTIIAYRVGAEDAKLLAPIFAPAVTERDLLECPNWQGYMRLHLSSYPTHPFSFHNAPDQTLPNPDKAKELAEASRLRWGIPAEEIDKRIQGRSKLIAGLPKTAELLRKASEQTPTEHIEQGSTLMELIEEALRRKEIAASRDRSVQAHITRDPDSEKDIRNEIERVQKQMWRHASWVSVYERTLSKARKEGATALEEPFCMFMRVNVDWFLALTNVLVEQHALTSQQARDFILSKLIDDRLDKQAQVRLNSAIRVLYSDASAAYEVTIQ